MDDIANPPKAGYINSENLFLLLRNTMAGSGSKETVMAAGTNSGVDDPMPNLAERVVDAVPR